MRNRISVVFLFAIVSAVVVGSCVVKKQTPDDPTVGQGWRPDGTYLAATFEGTFSIGRTRVRAADKATDLAVAKLETNGQARWLRSFSSLASGRAVASVTVGKNVAVVGIFAGDLGFDRRDQTLKSGDLQGLFFAALDPTGRVVGATLLARAQILASPDITYQGGRLVVNVPYEGVGDVGGKELPRGTGQTLLRFTVTPEGKLVDWDSPRAAVPPPPTQGKGTQGRLDGEKGAAGTGLVMASMMMQATCNACILDVPRTDPNCSPCRSLVCPGDSWCCTTGWDRQCMNEATTMCSPTNTFCGCPHGTCTTGVWLFPSCDPGTARNTCVQSVVCAGDTYCCDTGWDSQCVSESQSWCAPPGCF